MEIIKEVDGLKANGHYALAVVDHGQVFVSGQFSVDPLNGEKKFGTIEEEVFQALSNVERILVRAGSSKDKVLRATLYISDMNDWPAVNKVYADFFESHTPARTVVPVKELHYGFKVEVEVIASCD